MRMRDRFLQQEVWERMGVDVRQATQVLRQAPRAPGVPADAVLEDRAELQEARPARRRRRLAAPALHRARRHPVRGLEDTGDEELAGRQISGARGAGLRCPEPCYRPRREPSPVVGVVFLGGLGEIGRNCACIEVEGRILLLDCGLMFPDAGHARRRPRAPRLHLPAGERRPPRRASFLTRARGPPGRASVRSWPRWRRSRSTARRSRSAWPATASRKRGCCPAPS